MSNKELKPCPFCGGKADIMEKDENWFVVGCKTCIAYKEGSTKLKAINRWNTRNYPEKQDSSNQIPEVVENGNCKYLDIPEWQENEVLAWIVIELSQFCVLFFDYRKQFKSLIFSIRDKVSDIHHYEELGKFNTLEEAKAKANECIRELGERLLYFAENIRTKE